MNRRTFLMTIPFASGIPLMIRSSRGDFSFYAGEDELICVKKFELADSMNLYLKTLQETVAEMGKSFIGTVYEANTLEQPGEEHLVINLRGLDCVTFCENSLALARCIKMNKMTFPAFKGELQFIRYRSGVIEGYPSRLHYFSDFIFDNGKKKVLSDITQAIGGVPFEKKVDFMSTHPDDYPALKGQTEFIGMIKKQEEAINSRKLYHIPKTDIEKNSSKILDGDLLAITTSIEGMDVSHTGMALWQGGKLHFMHAPNVGYKVQITTKPLSEYLAEHSKQVGIMVARPIEP
jgi:hypothetical protein